MVVLLRESHRPSIPTYGPGETPTPPPLERTFARSTALERGLGHDGRRPNRRHQLQDVFDGVAAYVSRSIPRLVPMGRLLPPFQTVRRRTIVRDSRS